MDHLAISLVPRLSPLTITAMAPHFCCLHGPGAKAAAARAGRPGRQTDRLKTPALIQPTWAQAPRPQVPPSPSTAAKPSRRQDVLCRALQRAEHVPPLCANFSAHQAITNVSGQQSPSSSLGCGWHRHGPAGSCWRGRRPGCEHHLLPQPRAGGSEPSAPASAPPVQAQPGGNLSSSRSPLRPLLLSHCPAPQSDVGVQTGSTEPRAGEGARCTVPLPCARVTAWDGDSKV